MTMSAGRDDMRMVTTTEQAETFDTLLGHLVDMSGMRVSASVESVVISGVVVNGAHVVERAGVRWADLRLGEHVRVPISEAGLLQAGWVTDEHAPEKEVFAVLDRGGERELLIVLEPGQP
jgi:hypothetical protein